MGWLDGVLSTVSDVLDGGADERAVAAARANAAKAKTQKNIMIAVVVVMVLGVAGFFLWKKFKK